VGAPRKPDQVPDVADEVIDLSGDYELPEASVVIDILWGAPAERALEAAPRDVRFVQLGQSASPTATLQSGWIRGRMMNILGYSLFATAPDVIADGYRQLCEHVRDGRIAFRVQDFALDDVAEAWQRQASGSPGSKIVISVAS